eukprot:CAMPEP_0119025944 /NCGR_PEP_ID=MMETSP1176-20130426/34576_1 /TAXON_ID=265551 /ORGANISM="Synedropsis recta cf, Strain CCMP1620" /LENGTH=41 /DNA_ID= /DNA_START= /DNA_END= /DNA_ORIENTATION=
MTVTFQKTRDEVGDDGVVYHRTTGHVATGAAGALVGVVVAA